MKRLIRAAERTWYHGTSYTGLKKLAESGELHAGEYGGGGAKMSEYVFLASTINAARYYAFGATTGSDPWNELEPAVIIEIEGIPEDELLPDYDAVEIGKKRRKDEKPAETWRESVDLYQQACTPGPIPTSKITRVNFYNSASKQKILTCAFGDWQTEIEKHMDKFAKSMHVSEEEISAVLLEGESTDENYDSNDMRYPVGGALQDVLDGITQKCPEASSFLDKLTAAGYTPYPISMGMFAGSPGLAFNGVPVKDILQIQAECNIPFNDGNGLVLSGHLGQPMCAYLLDGNDGDVGFWEAIDATTVRYEPPEYYDDDDDVTSYIDVDGNEIPSPYESLTDEDTPLTRLMKVGDDWALGPLETSRAILEGLTIEIDFDGERDNYTIDELIKIEQEVDAQMKTGSKRLRRILHD